MEGAGRGCLRSPQFSRVQNAKNTSNLASETLATQDSKTRKEDFN